MPASNLTELRIGPRTVTGLRVSRPITNTGEGEFHSINYEEANPSGHDPFDIRLLDPYLAFKLGL